MSKIPTTLMVKIRRLMEQLQLPSSFIGIVSDCYVPLSMEFATKHQDNDFSLLAIQGVQGTGKSTCAAFVQLILEHQFGLRVLVTSLDDFYLTRAERLALADSVHPLLATRGVPGTHDIRMLQQLIEQLRIFRREGSLRKPIVVPVFDKSLDDRSATKCWQRVEHPVDVVILEGWCVGVPPQTLQQLAQPVNALERHEDLDGKWREYVNQQLVGDYSVLFADIDVQVTLQAPSFECVQRWRWLQEQKLVARLKSEGASTRLTLSHKQLQRFIDHYQRLSEHALIVMPNKSDYLIELNEDHSVR